MKKKTLFTERLLLALEKKGMRQTDLCRESGINKSTLSQYISGKYVAKHDRAVMLAKALGCDPLWLEGYDVPMEAKPDDGGERGDDGVGTLPVCALSVDGRGQQAFLHSHDRRQHGADDKRGRSAALRGM